MKSLILFLLPLNALAASLTVNWAPTTQHTDGSAIRIPVSYKVYSGVKGSFKSFRTQTAALTWSQNNLVAGTMMCFEVSTIEYKTESRHSSQVCMAAS